MMNCIVRRLQAHDGQLERALCHSGGTPDNNENWPESKVVARKFGPLEQMDDAANWQRGPNGMDSQHGRNLDCDRQSEKGQSGRRCGPLRQRSSLSASCDLGGRKQITATRTTSPWPAQVLWLASVALLASCSILLASGQQSIIIDNSHHFRGGSGATSNKVAGATTTTSTSNTSDHHNHLLAAAGKLGQHFQPASLLAVQNKSINFTHVAVDELTGTIYLGATNWLLQVSGRDLRLEQALRTGPTSSDSSLARDCTPADCMLQLAQVELSELLPRLLVQGHNVADLSGREQQQQQQQQQQQGQWNNNHQRRAFTGATLHNSMNSSSSGSSSGGFGLLQHRRPTAAPMGGNITSATTTTATTSSQTGFPASGPAGTLSVNQQQHNNYNKILTIDYASGHLIVCGSLNQGACRRHQLGNLANFSELVPLPVASDDELSSTVALVVGGAGGAVSKQVIAGQGKQQPILYVAATNSRLGPPNREMVPAISARSLDWSSRDRAMQIIEHSFTDLARVDISFGLRDYYLVNYVHAFQHNNFIYFVTVQRKSALLQLEEWGYVTRLVRLCQNDLSFQSYAEMTLECSMEHSMGSPASEQQQQRSQRQQSPASGRTNYNLLQDAHLMQAGSQLAQQLGLTGGGGGSGGSKFSSMSGAAVLVGAFSQSRDHTTRSSQRSAICLFPMERIEQKFQENIDLCYNGTIKSRNMDYIAGSVNDCPRQQGPIRNQQNYCNEPVKLNGSLALVAEPIQTSESEIITSISSTLAPTSPINLQWSGQSGGKQQQANSIRQHQVLVAGTSDGQLKRFVVVASGARVSALEFDSVSLASAAAAAGTAPPSVSSQTGSGEPGQQSPILADLHLVPAVNPQLSISTSAANLQDRHQQFVVAASAQKLVKLRVNACKASAQRQQRHSPANSRQQSTAAAPGNNSSIVDECLACSQLQDPFCGWCSSLASCTTRDECLIHSIEQVASSAAPSDQSQQQQQQQQQQPSASIHWTPFDSIRCSNYQPVSPKNVPIQADASLSSSHLTLIDVNVRLNLRHNAAVAAAGANQQQLAARLSQAQFVCHFDYLSLWNKSATPVGSQQQQQQQQQRGGQPTGATTKATQARLNLHAGTAVIGCPLPVSSQRPNLQHQSHLDHARVKLSVRLTSTGRQEQSYEDDSGRWLLEQVLGMRSLKQQQAAAAAAAANQHEQLQNHLQTPPVDSIERELTFYDCSLNSDCHSCLSSGSQGRRWSCAWCPLSQKCTFNASHPDFGCAASAVASTTPHSANLPAVGGVSSALVGADLRQIRGSQLTVSLDRAQTSMLGLAIDRLERCPKQADSALTSASTASATANTIESDYNFAQAGRASSGTPDGPDGNGLHHNGRPASTLSTGASDIPQAPAAGGGGKQQAIPVAAINPGSSNGGNNNINTEILVPNNVRRAIQVGLSRPVHHYQPRDKRVMKLECLIELEGAKARFSARLLDNSNVACQESLFSYQAEISTQSARLSVILNDNQVIETTDVIIYKCHLFGVNPPAIASSIVTAASALPLVESDADNYDTQSYRPAHNHHSSASWSSNLNELLGLLPNSALLANSANPRRQSDCSLCLNVDRKYQCVWCSNQCRHTEQCQELPTSTCPPPQIDSIHPTSGPIEGGTLLTIEGSNLGSNEREIQDKILVGGGKCQLVMYSVSTRIVCKTGPSLVGPQSATVFVGNRAGVTSPHEKFDYKAIHLADVNPRIGPVSGGTRLLLTGANLNIGSRVQILLDEIPCQLDSQFLMTSNQIACITGPNLFASSSMRIKQLTLIVDNSSHQLPFPFTYQPDPIITSIEPAESFLSGGRLILINGQHLDSPQSIKLQLQLEHRASVTNSTACQRLNDTLITCLTPAFSRADLREALEMSGQQEADQLAAGGGGANSPQEPQTTGWVYEGGGGGGGVRLKMSLLMDDVRSVRNLDEYYHHLPHYISYFEDPQLQPLEPNQIDYREELVILGDHLGMRQLDQDMQISVGLHICRIKSIQPKRILVEPPPMIAPVFDYNDSSRRRVLVDRPLLPIVALIGANLRFELGFMRYSSSQYLAAGSPAQLGQSALELESFAADMSPEQLINLNNALSRGGGGNPSRGLTTLEQTDGAGSSSMGLKVLLALGSLGFVLAISAGLALAMARFKQTRAQQREYKRIQLQMGSLDQGGSGNAQAGNANLFASVLFDKNKGLHHQLFANTTQPVIMDYVGNTTKSRPLNQFFLGNNSAMGRQQQVFGSFPPSPLTDISSLIGSSPNRPNLQQPQQQHVVRLNASGQPVSSAASQHQYAGLYAPAGSSSSSSPSATSTQQRSLNSSSARNFNWTQKAPSTIVPYAVIAACNSNSDPSQVATHLN